MLVSLDQIRAAADRIRGTAVRTPLLAWEDGVWLKPESLQPVGAFKMRGAFNRLSTLTDAERAPRASSPTRAATMPRPWPDALDCSGSTP